MCPELANPLSRRSKRSQEQRVPKWLLFLPSPAPAAADQTSGTNSLFPGAVGHQTTSDRYTREGLTLATGQREIVFPPQNTRVDSTAPLDKLPGSTCFQERQMKQIKCEETESETKQTCVFSSYTWTHFQQIYILELNHMADITFNVVLFESIKTVYLFAFLSTFQQTVRNKTKLYGSSSSISWYFSIIRGFSFSYALK